MSELPYKKQRVVAVESEAIRAQRRYLLGLLELKPTLCCCLNDFDIGDEVSRGNYGVVYKATRRKDRKICAVKVFGYALLRPSWRSIREEVDTMLFSRNAHRIELLGIFFDKPTGLKFQKRYREEYPVLVMELLDMGGLYQNLMGKFRAVLPTVSRSSLRVEGYINEGGFGKVFSAVDESVHVGGSADGGTGGVPVAVKLFGYTVRPPQLKWIMKEIEMMALLKQRGLASITPEIRGVFVDTSAKGTMVPIHPPPEKPSRKLHSGSWPAIVMERLSGGDLCDRVRFGQLRNTMDIRAVFFNILKAVHALHTKGRMVNCDMKLDNVVFVNPGSMDIKIVDFGLALPLPEPEESASKSLLVESDNNLEDAQVDTSVVHNVLLRGTAGCYAPETLKSKHQQYEYSPRTDVWQCGCMLYAMLYASYPFGNHCLRHSLEESVRAQHPHQCSSCGRIVSDKPTSEELALTGSSSVSLEWQDLIHRMLEKDPKKRITLEQALAHPALCAPESPVDDELSGEESHTQRKDQMHTNMVTADEEQGGNSKSGAGIGMHTNSGRKEPNFMQVAVTGAGGDAAATKDTTPAHLFRAPSISMRESSSTHQTDRTMQLAAASPALGVNTSSQPPVSMDKYAARLSSSVSETVTAATTAKTAAGPISTVESATNAASTRLASTFTQNIRAMHFRRALQHSLQEKIVVGMRVKDRVRECVLKHYADGLEPENMHATMEHFRTVRTEFLKLAGKQHTKALNLSQFHEVLRVSHLGWMCLPGMFEIFDADGSGSVDYFEFLLGLFSFRSEDNSSGLLSLRTSSNSGNTTGAVSTGENITLGTEKGIFGSNGSRSRSGSSSSRIDFDIGSSNTSTNADISVGDSSNRLTDKEMAAFYFEIFDVMGDGSISREEMFWVLAQFFVDGVASDDLFHQDLFDRFDMDGDGRIDKEEFTCFFCHFSITASTGTGESRG